MITLDRSSVFMTMDKYQRAILSSQNRKQSLRYTVTVTAILKAWHYIRKQARCGFTSMDPRVVMR
jgi:hypothetical protein